MTITGINVNRGAKKSIEKAGGTPPVEVKPIKEKFMKTTKKIDKKNSQTKEDSAE